MRILSVTLVLLGCFALVLTASYAEDLKPVKPVEYNLKQLVKQAALAYIVEPGAGDPPYRIDPEGNLFVLPGITVRPPSQMLFEAMACGVMPLANELFRTVPLSLTDWGLVALAAIPMLLLGRLTSSLARQ